MKRSVLAVFLILLISCSKQSRSPRIETLAILTAENLSGDESLNWIGEAVPALLSLQMQAHRAAHARDAIGRNITRVYCRYTKSDLDCWKDGEGSTIHASGSLEQGLPSIVNTIAKALDANARPTPSIPVAALKAYAEKNFEEAIRLDPNFGLAYTEGASALVATGNRDRAMQLVDAGIARKTEIPEPQQAQLAFLKASLTGDRDGQISALGWMTKLDKNDTARLKTYAQYLLAARKLPEAAAAQESLANLLPDDPDTWNTLGYFRAYAGDLAGAKQALEKYQQLSPNSANALDSLGEVHFYLGKFAEAEKYFLEAYEKQPQFNGGEAMYKAAISKFRAGDRTGAKQLFDKFAANLKINRDWLEIRWEYLTGSQEKAEAEAKAFATKNNSVVAWSHIAMWSLMRGDANAAKAANRQAVDLTPQGQNRGDSQVVSLIFRFWDAKEQPLKLVPPMNFRQAFYFADAWALLLRENNRIALQNLKSLFEETSVQNDRDVRILYASAENRLGKKDRAQALLKFNTVPPSAVESAIESVLFVKELELKR